jgi:nitrogen-specific signal transduction histidine kinase
MGIPELVEGLNTPVVACDASFKVVYANPACKQAFKALLHVENFVGNDMAACHKPETMAKLERLAQEFKDKKKQLHHYTMEVPGGKVTVVDVPAFDGDRFAGIVEFVFSGSLT